MLRYITSPCYVIFMFTSLYFIIKSIEILRFSEAKVRSIMIELFYTCRAIDLLFSGRRMQGLVYGLKFDHNRKNFTTNNWKTEIPKITYSHAPPDYNNKTGWV